MPYVDLWHGGAEARVLSIDAGVRVVLLQGGDAQQAWKEFGQSAPSTIARRGLVAVPTFHPENQALQISDPAERQRRIDRRIEGGH
jgi:hypothetical protein